MHTSHPSSIDASSNRSQSAVGCLALAHCGKRLRLQVLQSAHGFYIGTATEDGPFSRESVEYFDTAKRAQDALDGGTWTQKDYP